MSNRKAAALIVLACAFDEEARSEEMRQEAKRKERNRRIWRKDWLGLRETDGFCAKLLTELRTGEPALYRNFVRMTAVQFDHLLGLVKPFIEKEDTNMRMSISASERLVLTLRFLATGDNFASLQYTFRIPQTTISRIIPEVLDAIYKVLVGEYIKVIN